MIRALIDRPKTHLHPLDQLEFLIAILYSQSGCMNHIPAMKIHHFQDILRKPSVPMGCLLDYK